MCKSDKRCSGVCRSVVWMPLDTCWPPERLAKAMHRFHPNAVIAPSGFKASSLSGPLTMLSSLLPPGCLQIAAAQLQPQDPAYISRKLAGDRRTDSQALASDFSACQPRADWYQLQKKGTVQAGVQTPAYVICTSGSTGTPSAVCGTQSGMA